MVGVGNKGGFLVIGNILNNRYRLDKELGSGGFATVYAGYDLQEQKEIAVKITNDLISRNSEHFKAFLDELSALARLPQHSHIISIRDYGVVGEKTFLVMDYARYGTLEARLQQFAPAPLDFALTGRLFSQMAGALAHAHQYNVVHRDIKPENMLFLANDRLVVSDFGLARQFKSQMTQSINLFGSPPYVAPERWADKVGPASDVYALGVILHQMLTGSLPFQANDPLAYLQLHVYQPAPRLRQLRPDLPRGLDELLEAMLAKQADQRPPATELVSRYQQALQQATGYYQPANAGPARRTTPYVPGGAGPVRTSGRMSLGADTLPPAAADANPDVQHWTGVIYAKERVADNFAKRAQAYLVARAPDKAIADYTEALRLDPRNPVTYFERGKVYGEARQYSEAVADYSRAVKLAPQFPSAYEHRAEAYLALRQFSNAIADYEAALRFNSQHPEIYNKRAMAYKLRADAYLAVGQNGKQDEAALHLAIADYDQAIRLNPQDARLYKERGNAWRVLGKSRRAIADYSRAIRLNLEHAEIYSSLGDVYLESRQYKNAITEYNRALKLPGWSVRVFKNRGYAHYCLRKYRPALSDYNEAIKLTPGEADLWCQRGNTYFALREYQKALHDYDEAVRLEPSNLGPLYQRAMALSALGRFNEGLDTLKYHLSLSKDRHTQRIIRQAITRLENTLSTTNVKGSRQRLRP